MPDYQQDTTVAAPPSALFAFLADVRNLPRYFDKMRSAEPQQGGDAVRTEAVLDGGRHVEGEAWFRADHDTQTVAWGSEGPSGYRGELRVSGDGGTSRVEVKLHTERGHGDAIDDSLRETLANVRLLVEADVAPSS